MEAHRVVPPPPSVKDRVKSRTTKRANWSTAPWHNHQVIRVWLASLLGLGATIFAAVWVDAQPGVYVGVAQVMLLPPAQALAPNPLKSSRDALGLAQVVERVINGGPDGRGVVDQDLTLGQLGVREGTSIQLHNDGTQWADDFNRPALDIKVVDVTRAAAKRRMDDAIARVRNTLEDLQDEQQVVNHNRVTTELAPANPTIVYDDGHPSRGVAMTCLLGGGATLMLTSWLVRRRRQQFAGLGSRGAAASLEIRHPHVPERV